MIWIAFFSSCCIPWPEPEIEDPMSGEWAMPRAAGGKMKLKAEGLHGVVQPGLKAKSIQLMPRNQYSVHWSVAIRGVDYNLGTRTTSSGDEWRGWFTGVSFDDCSSKTAYAFRIKTDTLEETADQWHRIKNAKQTPSVQRVPGSSCKEALTFEY